MPFDYMPPTTNGVMGDNRPPVLPPIPRPGAGRDAGIRRRNDPAEITGRIQNIFSNLGAALGTDSESETDRLARLTREVQAGRSFDNLRTSASNIARQATVPQRAPATRQEYPIEAASISPELQRILETRRIQTDQSLEEAQLDRDLFYARAKQQADLQETNIKRFQQTQNLETQRRLAARGVARSPMFSNPAQREIFETANRASGEVRLNLAKTLSDLNTALRKAQSQSQRDLAEINFDEAAARSNVGRLLGVQ